MTKTYATRWSLYTCLLALALLTSCRREATAVPTAPTSHEPEHALAPFHEHLELVPVEVPCEPVIHTVHARPADNAVAEHIEPLLQRVLHEAPPADQPRYGHAPDYAWLTGELRYVYVRDAWCLQYASADEDDDHGGSVTLVSPGSMSAFRTGQNVRVEGRLLDPCSREPSPSYEVRSLKSLENR